jgi:hypothetical protein
MTTDLTRAEIQALIGGDVAVSRRSVAECDNVLIRPKTVCRCNSMLPAPVPLAELPGVVVFHAGPVPKVTAPE